MNINFTFSKTLLLFLFHIISISASIDSALYEINIYVYSPMLVFVFLSMATTVFSGATTPRMALFYLSVANTKVYDEVRHKYENTRAADYFMRFIWLLHNMFLFNIVFIFKNEFNMAYKLIWFLFFIASGLIDVLYGYIAYRKDVILHG